MLLMEIRPGTTVGRINLARGWKRENLRQERVPARLVFEREDILLDPVSLYNETHGHSQPWRSAEVHPQMVEAVRRGYAILQWNEYRPDDQGVGTEAIVVRYRDLHVLGED